MNEFKWIDFLKRTLPKDGLKTGIGDDAAVFSAGRGDLVWTTDAVVDGVDFRLPKITPREAGRKALAVNLSDLAAMGALPEAYTVTLGIPRWLKEPWLRQFYRGMTALGRRYGAVCAGGDLSTSPVFFASVSLLGRVPSGAAVLRSGARPGDWIGVTGTLGGSITRKHLAFEPRLREGAWLARRGVRAMLDISDGMVQDLRHLLRASGCAALVDLEGVPVSQEARRLSRGKDRLALARALSDGEDFELLFTVPASKRGSLERDWRRLFGRVRLSWIGRIEKGTAGSLRWKQGDELLKSFYLKKEGYAHR